MPQKHAKNNCASKCFNHWERNEASTSGSYGTRKVRLGGDSQLTFGHCSLCVHPAVEPMASPSGHVYCKECIVEFLLAKTQELRRQKEEFEAQAASEATDEVVAGETRRLEEEGIFMSTQTQLVIAKPPHGDNDRGKRQQGTSNDSSSTTKGKKRSREEEHHGNGKPLPETEIQKDLTQQAILKSKKEKQKELESSSWWLPQFQPAAPKAKISEPPKRPASPMSGEPLRAKDLVPVTFTLDADKAKTAHLSGGDSNKGSIICPVTRKGIISQKAVLIKRTGHVILEDAVKQFALPSMTCPVTGEKIKKKDLIPLVNGGTSFTASGQVEVTKYAPGLR